MIRDIAHNHDENKPGLMAIIECDLDFSLGFQGKTKSCDDFMAVFKARVDTINAHKGHACSHPGHTTDTFDRIILEKGLTKADVKQLPDPEQKSLKKIIQDVACEEYFTVPFIKQADKVWYSELKTTLANGYSNPTSTECNYSKDLKNALRLLKGYTSIGSVQRHNNNNDNKNGMAFVKQQQDWSDKHCFECNRKGHQVSNCKSLTQKEKEAVSA